MCVNVDKNKHNAKITIEENIGVILNNIYVFLSKSPLRLNPTKLNIPTIEQVILVLNAWLQKYHYEQPCPHVEGKTIGEVINAGRGEGINIKTLDDLMMAREVKNI